MYGALSRQGVRVPNGFALTAGLYRASLQAADAWPRLAALLDGVGGSDVRGLRGRGRGPSDRLCRHGNRRSRALIAENYRQLEEEYGPDVAVAVRSSATAEDLPTASFAGQHESFLNVRGVEALFEACRRCFASVFTDRAIVYRNDNGFDHLKIGLSVGVMKMVRSDRAASGVIFTLDTETGLPRRRVRDGLVRPGRERRPGTRRSRRILRPQADLPGRPPRVLRHALGSKQRAGLRRPAERRQHGQRRDAGGRPRALLHRRCRRPEARRLRAAHRGPLLAAGRPRHADGHRMGEGRPRRRALHRAGPARDGGVAQADGDASRRYAEGRRPGAAVRAARSARRAASGPCAISPDRPILRPSGQARCWSPIRPAPTGSR